jgi:hypothetical protein
VVTATYELEQSADQSVMHSRTNDLLTCAVDCARWWLEMKQARLTVSSPVPNAARK